MIKKFVLFVLALNILVLFAACSSDKAAAYENGAESDKTAIAETSDRRVKEIKEAGTAETDETADTAKAAQTAETAKTVEAAETAVTERTGPTASTVEGMDSTASDVIGALPDEIIKTDAAYSQYDSDIFEADYDGDGAAETFYVFTDKSAWKKGDIGCPADIWFGNDNEVKRVAEWQCIQPDTYGSLELAGKYYFRYDLAFATETQTILLSVKDGKSIESYNCGGFAEFGDKTDDFAVTDSTYDMVYLKSDDLTCGHTWKKYFYYADAEGFHEYGAKNITRKEFLQYHGADRILDEIGKEYGKDGVSLSYGFLKRCNGLLHVNINSETKDDITHYYITCKIAEDGSLVKVESGEGYYAPANNRDIAVYK